MQKAPEEGAGTFCAIWPVSDRLQQIGLARPKPFGEERRWNN